jgi:glycerol-3-phosphate dehydrogenase (NAD(P)+)
MRKMNDQQKVPIAVLGAGGWGTALADLLAKNGHRVHLWVYEKELADEMIADKENTWYLPGVKLSENLTPSNVLEEVVSEKLFVVVAIPTQYIRSIISEASVWIRPGASLLSVSKGIENDSMLLVTELLSEFLGEEESSKICCLSGPSFACEVARETPTAVCIASENIEVASLWQKIFSNRYFRAYTSDDPVGVQIGGALKNVIALAAGVCDGLGLGENSKAALITRGLAEIRRLAVKKGANPLTLAGLSGIGDLVLTCTSRQSRNWNVGYMISQGRKLKEIEGQMRGVAEGVSTTLSAYRMSVEMDVEMPITQEVYHMIYEGKPPRETLDTLMRRDLKPEIW